MRPVLEGEVEARYDEGGEIVMETHDALLRVHFWRRVDQKVYSHDRRVRGSPALQSWLALGTQIRLKPCFDQTGTECLVAVLVEQCHIEPQVDVHRAGVGARLDWWWILFDQEGRGETTHHNYVIQRVAESCRKF